MEALQISTLAKSLAVGVAVSLAFLFGASRAFFFIHELMGSPRHATVALWAALIVASFLFSFIGGWLVHFSCCGNRRLGHQSYLLSLLVVAVGVCFGRGGGAGILEQLRSAGFWALVLGAVTVPALTGSGMHLTTRLRPTPPSGPRP